MDQEKTCVFCEHVGFDVFNNNIYRINLCLMCSAGGDVPPVYEDKFLKILEKKGIAPPERNGDYFSL